MSTNGGQLEISWLTSFAGYGLESISDLPASNTWAFVTNPPVTNNGTISVTLPFTSFRQFFRLAK